jgi:hypothetical protein
VLVSTPRGAEVREGEALVCAKTPCSAHLGNGPHELTFTRGNAAPVTERVEVTTSTVAVVDVSLERRRAGIQLATEPSGATVVLDDRPLPGLTPMPLPELVIGQKVKLRIAKEGFETFDSIVEVKDPGLDPWRFTLPSTTTSWTVTPTPDDAIIDGGGRVHEGALVVSIAHQGSAAYNVLRPGCDPKAVALSGTGRAAEERPVALTCRPFDGSLTIRARRLAVRIDGVDLIKKAPLDAYPLPAGSHAVTLRNAKGRTETVTVEVKRGETFVLQSKLK